MDVHEKLDEITLGIRPESLQAVGSDQPGVQMTVDLVEELGAPANDSSGGPKRRYYRRTDFGRMVAAAESDRLKALLEIAEAQDLLARDVAR